MNVIWEHGHQNKTTCWKKKKKKAAAVDHLGPQSNRNAALSGTDARHRSQLVFILNSNQEGRDKVTRWSITPCINTTNTSQYLIKALSTIDPTFKINNTQREVSCSWSPHRSGTVRSVKQEWRHETIVCTTSPFSTSKPVFNQSMRLAAEAVFYSSHKEIKKGILATTMQTHKASPSAQLGVISGFMAQHVENVIVQKLLNSSSHSSCGR